MEGPEELRASSAPAIAPLRVSAPPAEAAPINHIEAAIVNRKTGKTQGIPSENSSRWEYYLMTEFLPVLENGDYVLVEVFGRVRKAVVSGKIPGKLYWACLAAPVSGCSRVVVSKHTLKAIARNEK